MRHESQDLWDEAARLLTEGERSKDVEYRHRLAREVQRIFNNHGYPDWWSRLTRFEDDTKTMERMRRPAW